MLMDMRNGRIMFEDGDVVRVADGGHVEAAFRATGTGADWKTRCAPCYFAVNADACLLSRFCRRTYFADITSGGETRHGNHDGH